MRLPRRRLAGVDPPANLGPRIAIWGTFDIADYATLLLPRIYERELAARLPLAETDVYSPLGYNHPLRIDGGRPALPLRAPGRRRKRQLADRHDLVVVSGAVIHTRDEHYGQLYSLPREETDRLRPSEFLLDGLGTKLELRCPVVWSAVAAPLELSGAEAERVRTALEARSHVSVRDERSREILVGEGVSGRSEVVGDVMADACLRLAPIAKRRSNVLERLGVEPARYLLLTLHREANTRQPRLGRIAEGLRRLEEPVVFPAHPRTRAALEAEGIELGANVLLLEPLGYLDLTALASQARVILTDSGGLQKEAYWHGVPCVTLRPSTEWVDTVEVGANALVDDDPDRLVAAVAEARMPNERPQLYGDGHAAERIAEALDTLPPK